MNITTAPRTALAALLTGSALLCAALPAAAQMAPAAPKSETVQLIEKALASEIRTPEERARDARERKPVQTLEFFGLKPDMTVVELMPGAGWYTKILGQVLAEKGKLYIAMGAARLAPRLAEWKLDKVVVADGKTELKPSGQFGVFDAPVIDLPIKDVDMVLTFRNLHNMTPETRAKLNRAVFTPAATTSRARWKPGVASIRCWSSRNSSMPASSSWTTATCITVPTTSCATTRPGPRWRTTATVSRSSSASPRCAEHAPRHVHAAHREPELFFVVAASVGADARARHRLRGAADALRS